MGELAAISAVASVLQLVSFVTTVIDRLKDFHNQTSRIPKVFRHLAIELPVLRLNLERLKEAFEAPCVDQDAKSTLLPALE
jgi:hypothetical protein